MQIRILTSMGIMIDEQVICPAPGEVVDVPSDEAQRLIEAGLAEAVESEQKSKKK